MVDERDYQIIKSDNVYTYKLKGNNTDKFITYTVKNITYNIEYNGELTKEYVGDLTTKISNNSPYQIEDNWRSLSQYNLTLIEQDSEENKENKKGRIQIYFKLKNNGINKFLRVSDTINFQVLYIELEDVTNEKYKEIEEKDYTDIDINKDVRNSLDSDIYENWKEGESYDDVKLRKLNEVNKIRKIVRIINNNFGVILFLRFGIYEKFLHYNIVIEHGSFYRGCFFDFKEGNTKTYISVYDINTEVRYHMEYNDDDILQDKINFFINSVNPNNIIDDEYEYDRNDYNYSYNHFLYNIVSTTFENIKMYNYEDYGCGLYFKFTDRFDCFKDLIVESCYDEKAQVYKCESLKLEY